MQVALEVRPPLIGAGVEDDPIRVVCDHAGLELFAITRARVLVRVRCDAETCHPIEAVADRAASLDAVRTASATFVAWAGDSASPQIRLARWDPDAGPITDAPAACWDSGEGMCGPPLLVAGAAEVMVAAREHSDLRVVRVLEDGGFARLPGL